MSIDSLTAIANRHDFDTTFTNEYDSDQDLSVVTPSSGKLLKITGISVTVEGTASTGSVRLAFAGNTVAEIYAGGTESTLLKDVVIRGIRNEALQLVSTLGADQNFFLQINYKEE